MLADQLQHEKQFAFPPSPHSSSCQRTSTRNNSRSLQIQDIFINHASAPIPAWDTFSMSLQIQHDLHVASAPGTAQDTLRISLQHIFAYFTLAHLFLQEKQVSFLSNSPSSCQRTGYGTSNLSFLRFFEFMLAHQIQHEMQSAFPPKSRSHSSCQRAGTGYNLRFPPI